ncbi:hypothetical protein B0T26DRAFT_871541 [Lasiosphaeria miniovina]|uniref:Cyclochlorotine biosynthesis protein O n=1 Tax=Lasiosphaeria miniovina TaxID=1954250 RepID=A0AA40AJF7_9PEZI|nr:uncharacterized protein B0T26DRAFT_871541 [Lasiosphaeria miniovina]KAK0716924.1 hypothetical protein B0T26DRAFT_871541 [Lasiosphaeria miniovina]
MSPTDLTSFDADTEQCPQLLDSPLRARHNQKRSVTREQAYSFALHVLITLLVVLLWGARRSTREDPGLLPCTRGQTWSPLQDSIEYETSGKTSLDYHKFSRYSGPPSQEQDDAWDELLRPVMIRASRAEMQRAGEKFESMAALADGGGGYLATIAVYHELHCLRRLRNFVFQSRYYPNLTAAEDAYLHSHLDHCIESLRLTVMCHANLALYSFAWIDPTRDRPVATTSAQAVCARWSSVDGWARARMVSPNPAVRPRFEG